MHKYIAVFSGPFGAAVVGVLLHAYGWDAPACWTGALTCLCALWWMLEPIPIAVTSIIPLALFPMIEIVPRKMVAQQYGSKVILLLMGGFMLSVAMERCGVHLRLARGLYTIFGKKSDRGMVFAIMACVALLSMWMSSTAIVLMFFPVVMALIEKAERTDLAVPLLLGLAYASSVGGLGTPVGTAPNLIFMDQYEKATGVEISFFDWMCIGIPVVCILVPLMWLWLTRSLRGRSDITLPEVGAWTTAEKRVLFVFALTGFFWVTRSHPWGGWSTWFSTSFISFEKAYDADTALVAVIAMFLIPNGTGGKLLDWESCKKIPWGVLLLVAGGFTMATGFKETGLSDGIGVLLSGLTGWNTVYLIAGVAAAVIFLTEVTSNNATTVLLMPILSVAAVSAGIEPKTMMVPAVLCASCAFMLPVATAPNAIIYGSGHFSTQTMMKEGMVLNVIGIIVVTVVSMLLV